MPDKLIKYEGQVCRVLEVEILDRETLLSDIEGSKQETARLEQRLVDFDALNDAPADEAPAEEETPAAAAAEAPAEPAVPAEPEAPAVPEAPATPATNAAEPTSDDAEFADLPAAPSSPTHIFPL